MPKVLIVAPEMGNSAMHQAATLLRSLGIDYDFATGDNTSSGAPLRTPVGELNASSNDCRNFLRNYDAVLIVRHSQPLELSASIRIAGYWLSWNDPEDPPLLYFGWNFSVAVTQLNALLPSDFPLARPDNANLADTVAVSDNGIPSFSVGGAQAGVASYLHREAVALITPLACVHRTDNSTGMWRYNPTQHATLANQTYTHRIALNNRAGELLVTPAAQPDESYPSNTVIAYRYKNCVFLPLLRLGESFVERYRVYSNPVDLFWLLYGLKVAGVQPVRTLPIFIETDHPLENILATRVDGLTNVDTVNGLTAINDYFRDFCRRTGMTLHHGLATGGMERGSNLWSHWWTLHATRYGGTQALEDAARRCHEVLLAGHREGTTPCGFHDHNLVGSGLWGGSLNTNFRRHQSTSYDSPYSPAGLSFPLQAPNDVHIRKGNCCVRKAHSPVQAGQGDAVAIEVGGETYVEWNYPSGSMTGSAAQFDLAPDSLQAAQMVIESNIAELRAMGFPDGHGGEHGYTNTANNYSGGPCYWEAARRYGYKALRSTDHFCNGVAGQRITRPMNFVWNGFHLIPGRSLDIVQNTASSTISYGLYRAGVSSGQHAVGNLGLDNGGDISTNYPNTAWRAHRRVLARQIGRWLAVSLIHLGAPYIHPTSWAAWNPQDPLARFDGVLEYVPGHPHWNGIVELMENMAVIVGVLSGYLKFGSVSDTIAIRERVIA